MDLGGEDRLLRRLRRRLERAGNNLIGDDAAFVSTTGDWAISVDQQIAGVHFPRQLDPAILGRRALAVALSDLAAVGAEPRYVLLALAFPSGFDAERLIDAVDRACRGYGALLAGGDLARSELPTATLTVVGRRPTRGRWLRRDLARPGDVLWAGGRLGLASLGRLLIERGAAIIGRRVELPRQLALAPSLLPAARRAVRSHLQPSPQLELGLWLARRGRAAAIDVSDGLALDLHRLCRESEVGARVDTRALVGAAPDQSLAERLSVDHLELVLSGGEDYALLFCLASSISPPERFRCRSIGTITSSRRVLLCGSRGQRPLPATGWDHLAPPRRRVTRARE